MIKIDNLPDSTCPFCQGRGFKRDGETACPRCYGTGEQSTGGAAASPFPPPTKLEARIMLDAFPHLAGLLDALSVTADAFHGAASAFLSLSKPCPKCQGRGKVYSPGVTGGIPARMCRHCDGEKRVFIVPLVDLLAAGIGGAADDERDAERLAVASIFTPTRYVAFRVDDIGPKAKREMEDAYRYGAAARGGALPFFPMPGCTCEQCNAAKLEIDARLRADKSAAIAQLLPVRPEWLAQIFDARKAGFRVEKVAGVRAVFSPAAAASRRIFGPSLFPSPTSETVRPVFLEGFLNRFVVPTPPTVAYVVLLSELTGLDLTRADNQPNVFVFNDRENGSQRPAPIACSACNGDRIDPDTQALCRVCKGTGTEPKRVPAFLAGIAPAIESHRGKKYPWPGCYCPACIPARVANGESPGYTSRNEPAALIDVEACEWNGRPAVWSHAWQLVTLATRWESTGRIVNEGATTEGWSKPGANDSVVLSDGRPLAGEGWRILEGDRIEGGDEVWNPARLVWIRTLLKGFLPRPGTIYRRRLN